MPPKKSNKRRQNLSVRLEPQLIWDLKKRAVDCHLTMQNYLEAVLEYDVKNKIVPSKGKETA